MEWLKSNINFLSFNVLLLLLLISFLFQVNPYLISNVSFVSFIPEQDKNKMMKLEKNQIDGMSVN